MIRSFAIGLVGLILSSANATAADPADTPGSRPVCDRAHAVSATVRDLVKDVTPYLGRCVGVRGIWEGGVLYADADAYDQASGMGDWDQANGVRIGAEAQAPLAERLEAHGPLKVVAYGYMDDCQRIRDEAEARYRGTDQIPFVGGYCHYTDGPRMVLSDVRIGRPSRDEQTRLTRQGQH